MNKIHLNIALHTLCALKGILTKFQIVKILLATFWVLLENDKLKNVKKIINPKII